MAILSNVNGKFAVDSTGAIQFSGSAGTSGYVLRSNGNAAPTWVDSSTVIGGPYLPLTGGTLSGALAGTSATFSSTLTVGGTAVFNGDMTLPAAADHFLIGAGSLQTTGRIKFGLPTWNNSIGLESYWMVMRSNSNEGYKFIDSGGNTYAQFNASTNSAGAYKTTFLGNLKLIAGASTTYFSEKGYLGDSFNFGTGETTDGVSYTINGAQAGTAGNYFRWLTQTGAATPTEKVRITSGGFLQVVDGAVTLNKSDGSFITFDYNGSTKGYIGSERQIVTGGSQDNMAFSSLAELSFATGSSLTKRMRITSGGTIQMTDENGGVPILQVRNFSTSATGAFTDAYAMEFRGATTTGSTGGMMLLHMNEANDARPTLNVSDSNGIFATFTNGKVGIGTTSPGNAKLYVNGGTTLGGSNNTDAGATRIFGDVKRPQAQYFVRRNYNLAAGASGALYSIARQWHDHANWGLGNINVIMWGIYYGQGQFNKADFSCRYGYGGGSADVQANFNTNSMAQPAWTAATLVSGNTHYRDLQIQIPAYHQISFEIISPGLQQTYNLSNQSGNSVYLYPH